MAYITSTDMTSAVGTPLLVTLFNDGAGAVSTTAINAAIADAEADANSILGPSFTVPVTSAAQVLKRACVDIAVYYGYERKPEFRRTGGDNPEQKRYDRAIKILREIRSGQRDMGSTSSTANKSGLVGGVVYSSTSRFIVEEDEATDGPVGPY